MREVKLDWEEMAKIGGVPLKPLDVRAIEDAAGWLAHWDYVENGDGGIPSPATGKNSNGAGKKLGDIQKHASALVELLSDPSPNGYAAADLSGGLYILDEVRALAERASFQYQRCREEVKINPKGLSVTTESRKTLISVVTRSWLEAGGSRAQAKKFNNWDQKTKPSPLLSLVQYVISRAIPNSPSLTPEQVQADIVGTEWMKE